MQTANACIYVFIYIYLFIYILCTYIKCIYLYIYVQFICPSFVIVTCLILFQINKSLDFPLCHPTSKARTGTAMDLIESNEAWAAAKVLKVDKVEIQVEVVQVVKWHQHQRTPSFIELLFWHFSLKVLGPDMPGLLVDLYHNYDTWIQDKIEVISSYQDASRWQSGESLGTSRGLVCRVQRHQVHLLPSTSAHWLARGRGGRDVQKWKRCLAGWPQTNQKRDWTIEHRNRNVTHKSHKHCNIV